MAPVRGVRVARGGGRSGDGRRSGSAAAGPEADYNVRGTVNPLNGEYYGPNTLGVLDQVIRIFPE